MKKVQGDNYFEPSTAAAMEQLLAQAASQGVNIHINEGYRPLGSPNDQYVTNESQTSTGGSNQWFQLGRMHRGETPSAGTPGTSSHGWGMAADINPGHGNSVVRSIAESLGLVFTLDSEPWHAAFGGGGGGGSFSPSADVQRSIQQILKDQGLYSGVVDGEFGPLSWKAVQSWLTKYSLYNGPIDGDPGPKTYAGFQNYGKKNGNYDGAVDGILGPRSWAGFAQSLKEDTAPAPAPAKSPEPAKATAPAATPAAPAKQEAPKPEAQPAPIPPVTPVTPVKETVMPEITPLPEQATTAATDSLGILIPDSKNRKIAYALYGLTSLIISNVAVGVLASGIQAPVWLVVAMAVVGNLAAPFTTLAIANASTKK
jgi:peptidoglycan hydrolase-like protein with peptidoglycan-binding domain